MISITTTVFASTSSNLPPGEVTPGHITFEPLNTCFIAPLSTCICGIKNGSKKKIIKQIMFKYI